MNINIKNYERTLIKVKVNNTSITKIGHKVDEHLVVSHIAPQKFGYQYRENEYRVYRSWDGLPVIATTFNTKEDAIRFAKWISSIYKEHFHIWIEYPHIPLFQVTYLTVKNGEEYWQYLLDLETKRRIEWKGYENVPKRSGNGVAV
jgi:hypothetical protein